MLELEYNIIWGITLGMIINMVPTRTGKPEKMREHFQSGKSQRISIKLANSGNFTQNTGNSRYFVLEN